jgi:hypothetical protein
MVEGKKSNMKHLIYYKNFCKRYNVLLPSMTILKNGKVEKKKKPEETWAPVIRAVILGTWEAEFGRIAV